LVLYSFVKYDPSFDTMYVVFGEVESVPIIISYLNNCLVFELYIKIPAGCPLRVNVGVSCCGELLIRANPDIDIKSPIAKDFMSIVPMSVIYSLF